MEKNADDSRGVERSPDLSGVFGGIESERKPETPDEWQESGTEDPAFFIKAAGEE